MPQDTQNPRSQLYILQLQLFATAPESPEYGALQAQIAALSNQREPEEENKRSANDFANPGMRYDENLAVYVDPNKHGTTQEVKERLDRLNSYPERKPGEIVTDPQELADKKWRNECLRESINGEQWLNNIQVGAATGGRVTVGTDDLGKFLAKNKGNLPLSVAHIVTGANKQNHFVSLDFRKGEDGKPEITYLDSNGDLMPLAERRALESQFPGVVVKYLDKEGNKIPEREAAENQDNILRVQFDDHNCGLYTSHAVNMFKAANGNSESIKAGVAKLHEISENPAMHRAILGKTLIEMANSPEMEKSIQAKFAANAQIPRLSERSPSVARTIDGLHGRITSNDLAVSSEQPAIAARGKGEGVSH